ncbi:helix-turn-helix domain-containing protein [Paenibacillus sp. FSL K6-2524]|uniref:helix-turn-helix domain-containing protein n=1 Tax=Paenibacillus sp. FSL K6-2524 TaxID=2954516 RepID=UPI0030FA0E43
MYDEYNEIITVEELAEYLRIGMNTAYGLVNSGEIQSFKIKNSYRIQRSAIVDFIIKKNSQLKN